MVYVQRKIKNVHSQKCLLCNLVRPQEHLIKREEEEGAAIVRWAIEEAVAVG